MLNAKNQISQGKAPGELEILKRCDIDDRGISLLIDSRQPNKQSAIKSNTSKIDPSLRYNQNGFRPGRSTITQVLTLRGILERVKNYHLRSIMVLIDFNKAFVSINHQAMFNIPERIKNAIMLKVATSKGRFYPLTVKQIIFNWGDIFLSYAGWLWHHIYLSLRLIMQSGKPHKKKRAAWITLMTLFFCLTRLGKPGSFYAMGI